MVDVDTARYLSTDVLPADVVAALPEGFVRAFQENQGFSGLGQGLEKTAALLSSRFDPPRLLVDRTPGGNFLCFLRFDSSDASVSAIVSDRETLELYPVAVQYRALPPIFRSYYQWFEGMQLLSPGEEPSLAWTDLPCAYNGRIELSDLARRASLPADVVKGLYARFESKSLQAWLCCRSGDVFFADEFNKRGQLFHFHKDNIGQVSRVEGDDFLDEYVSFVIAGGEIGKFDLGPWLAPVGF